MSRSKSTEKSTPTKSPHANRETVESIAMAIILAMVFRTFVAEPFVIPTGSMAPTLMGNHKDVVCAKCGYSYQGGASCENEERLGADWGTATATTCPVCRYTMTLDWNDNANQATFTGDRILVNKFAYDLGDPQRWDVIVFKYPGNAKVNYIKRLIGLPNEAILLRNGDVFVAAEGSDEYQIVRKPPHKQLAMMQIVDDTKHSSQIAELREIGWPSRWQYYPEHNDVRTLTADSDGVSLDGSAKESWVRYRHLVLDSANWKKVEQGKTPSDDLYQGELISDFCSYNAVPKERQKLPVDFVIRPDVRYSLEPDQEGMNWVGDLAVEAELNVSSLSGWMLLDLVEGGVHFQCQIDVSTGQALLSSSNSELPFTGGAEPTGQTPIRGPGRYDIRYSNFDDEIRLWVNDKLIVFDKPTTYGGSPIYAPVPKWQPEDPGDLQPIGIGVRGCEMTVRNQRVWRDVYYVAGTSDYDDHPKGNRVRAVFRDPENWHNHPLFLSRTQAHYELGPEQYFPMGDNSPQSADARIWDAPKYVERDLLIGKAAAVYWPHSWNRPLPFLPNISKVRLIH